MPIARVLATTCAMSCGLVAGFLEQKHLQDLERFMHQSDMLLFNIENVENIEVKLLQNLSAKVRITNSSNSPNHQMQNNNTGKSLSEALIFASTNPQ